MTARVLVLATSTNRRGAEVEAAALTGWLSAHGVAAELAALAPGAHGGLDIPVLGDRLGPRALAALRHRAGRADVVLAYGSRTLPACAIALAGSPAPFVYRSIGDPRRWAGGPLHRRRTALFVRRAAAVVALWDGAARDLVELYGLAEARVRVVPNARDPAQFRPATTAERTAARAALGVGGDRPIVAMIGALSAEKQPLGVVHAMAAVPGAALVVAGDGPLIASAREQARLHLGDRARFLGTVGDVRPVLAAADVVVLNSTTEGMPGTVLEALLCGVPVVAPAVGALPELLAGDTASRLVPAGASPAVLAAAIRAALSGAPDRSGRQRARRAEAWTWDQVGPRWLAVVAEITGRQAG